MARDNYGAYDGTGYSLVPMEPKFRPQPDNGTAKRQEIEDAFYVDKSHPEIMGTNSDASNANRVIPKGYAPQVSMYDAFCDYAGYQAGNKTLVDLDEYKVLENTVFAVPIVYAEDCQTTNGQGGKERI
jgi:hypothetical protein